jgi:hypothetical protein
MATKADLRNAVLRFLSVLPEGQSASAHQTTVVETAIDREQAYLETEGIAWWETSAIPNEVMNPLREYIAAIVAPELLDPERAMPYAGFADSGLRRLRRVAQKPNQRVKALYY